MPDGTYTLQSVATDAAGKPGDQSRGVTVIVENTPPTPERRVSSPMVPGCQDPRVILDAGAPCQRGCDQGASSSLTGGSLNGARSSPRVASTTYGWIVVWNSTTVPDGTYTLQSRSIRWGRPPGDSVRPVTDHRRESRRRRPAS